MLWLWYLSVILCLPLVGFTSSVEDSSPERSSSTRAFQTEISSTLNSSTTVEQTIESSEYSSEIEVPSSVSDDETSMSEKKQNTRKEEPSVQAESFSEKFFISISDENYVLFKNLDGETIDDGRKNYQKTFAAQEVTSNDGTKYYLLSNSKREIGYINPDSTEKVTSEEGKLFSESNTYGSIISADAELFTTDFKQNGTTKNLKDQTFEIAGYYNHYDEKVYYLLKNSTDQSIGVVEESAVEKADNQAGIKHSVNDYYSVMKKDQKIWKDLNFDELGTTASINEKTFSVKEWYYHFNGKKYYALYDNGGIFRGFVEEGTIKKASSSGGIWRSMNQHITITKNNWAIWKDFNFKNGNSTKGLYQRTYKVTGYYNHLNGSKYLSVYDSKGIWQGYLNSEGAEVVQTLGGKWYGTNQYITITKNNWTIWKDFNFKNGSSTKSLFQRTYRVTGWYRHYNGIKYLSVYDNKGKWLGYLNEGGAQTVNNPGGKWNGVNQYISVTKNNWTIWKDFNFKNGSSTKNLYQRTYRITGWYRHYNGTKYLSVYDNKGKWMGYLNEDGAQTANNPGGKWNSTNQYVTVNKNNWSIWKDFNFQNGSSTKNLHTKTYQVTGWYRHFNGTKYLSLYDNKGKWQGYLNEGGAAKAGGAQGTGFSMNKSVLVIKSGYSIWNNFSWKEKTRTNSLINKTYQVKWYYKHMNGSTYYSLYDANGKWFGYVNSGAVRERRGVSHYLGNTRQKVLNELNAHQNDRFYLGTPFRLAGFSNPEMFLVPNGVPSVYGPGMNCTGFVATVTRRSGGNLNRISGITSGVGGYVNAYNWRDALTRNVEYYSFSSIDALLRSGKAQKGDLIYLEAVFTNPTYDCHIGIFWGNSPSENRFWHQVIDGNKISHIYSGTPYSKVYLFPQD
ncbi:hypothetical protein [Enterococcus sp.]|uniref:hypothetical protein n=1 Tax=Enterococcus sp. TaxID=35783 RepID=UPI00290A07BE|nr:hypothetical protein [Enterococcus sp.]MDU5335231.1 hypothetical protein [Enterococcus sp.]